MKPDASADSMPLIIFRGKMGNRKSIPASRVDPPLMIAGTAQPSIDSNSSMLQPAASPAPFSSMAEASSRFFA
jgi:hypothetical protein